tara:strand:- start:2944 stop:3174 length:231 start_codon:yes stop_codon:yes gene_type:complete
MYHGKKKKMMGGGKLKMVTNEKGDQVPFYAADGKGKMMHGGRVKKGHGGKMSGGVAQLEASCNKMAGYNMSLMTKK